jgi:hypothetical protein
MTHIWQMHNTGADLRFMLAGLVSRIFEDYTPPSGLNWQDYNIEQQGRIVERWYRAAASPAELAHPANPLNHAQLDTPTSMQNVWFRYIQNHAVGPGSIRIPGRLEPQAHAAAADLAVTTCGHGEIAGSDRWGCTVTWDGLPCASPHQVL